MMRRLLYRNICRALFGYVIEVIGQNMMHTLVLSVIFLDRTRARGRCFLWPRPLYDKSKERYNVAISQQKRWNWALERSAVATFEILEQNDWTNWKSSFAKRQSGKMVLKRDSTEARETRSKRIILKIRSKGFEEETSKWNKRKANFHTALQGNDFKLEGKLASNHCTSSCTLRAFYKLTHYSRTRAW